MFLFYYTSVFFIYFFEDVIIPKEMAGFSDEELHFARRQARKSFKSSIQNSL